MMNSLPMRTSSQILLLQGLTLVFLAIGAGSVSLLGQAARVSAARGTATVLIEPYAPNIVRVSISSIKSDALAGPGYGIVATPDYKGWSLTTDHGADVLQSDALKVTLAQQPPGYHGPDADTKSMFIGSTGYVGLNIDAANGTTLLHFNGWE